MGLKNILLWGKTGPFKLLGKKQKHTSWQIKITPNSIQICIEKGCDSKKYLVVCAMLYLMSEMCEILELLFVFKVWKNVNKVLNHGELNQLTKICLLLP